MVWCVLTCKRARACMYGTVCMECANYLFQWDLSMCHLFAFFCVRVSVVVIYAAVCWFFADRHSHYQLNIPEMQQIYISIWTSTHRNDLHACLVSGCSHFLLLLPSCHVLFAEHAEQAYFSF